MKAFQHIATFLAIATGSVIALPAEADPGSALNTISSGGDIGLDTTVRRRSVAAVGTYYHTPTVPPESASVGELTAAGLATADVQCASHNPARVNAGLEPLKSVGAMDARVYFTEVACY
ncbi:hypothetical protein F4677DRAFT_443756 [Hypoxylon crocopeplum]|nr:hypothetical protein F4677DRAFT_443756 [Hypoxylon crocopeplum]